MNTGVLQSIFRSFLMAVFLFAGVLPANAGDEYNGRIKGKIVTSDGKAAAWVTVHVNATGIATVTDEDGYFFLKNLKPGDYVLTFSYTGLRDQQKQIKVAEDET